MASQHTVNTVLKNCFSTVGEGPHWDGPSQILMCVDIFSGEVLRFDPLTQDHSSVSLDGTVGFVIPRSKGGFVVGLNKSVAQLDFNTKDVKNMVEVDEGTQNRFNDAKCDATGRLWAGTMGHETSVGKPVLGLGTLYSLSADHKLTSHLTKLGISNGLDWTDDSSVMYFIDSAAKNVVAFDFDLAQGTINNQRTVVEVTESGMVPDGMCVDAEGKLWVAFFGGSRVCRFDPETGKTLQTIMFPATNITSCCFGGKNLDELYVTSAKYGIPEAEVRDKQPLAGSLFCVTGLGLRGRAANNFAG